MDFNYTKIKLGNWLFKSCFPLYNFTYSRFKLKTDLSEINLLKSLVKEGHHVLDIGGNIGFYAKLLSKLVGPNGKVYSFEPEKINFKYLQKNTAGLNNVVLFNSAVSDKKGILKVYTSKLLNVDHRTYPIHNYDTVEEIEALSIDDLMAQKIIPKVDVIKIDIQGFEVSAFEGMKNLLKTNNSLKILAEYWPHGFKRAGTSALLFYKFFSDLGYKFSIIEKDSLTPLTENYVRLHNDEAFEFSFNVLIEKK